MAHTGRSSEIVLYIWPHQWNLPSFDASCLATVLYLQLAIPEKYCIIECTEPNLSPSGQFPFLVHGQEVVSSLASIIKYIAGLAKSDEADYPNANVDAFLSPQTRSQRNAWLAHIESNLGDLVCCALFSLKGNWEDFTHPALASLFPVPQRYYAPQILRESYQPRLEAARLWHHMEPKKSKPDLSAFQRTFEKEKIVTKARSILDIYSRLIAGNDYIYQNKISTLDVALASRVLLLLTPLYPNSVLKDLLDDSYLNVSAHAMRVHDLLLGSDSPLLTTKAHHKSLTSLLDLSKPKSSASAKVEDPKNSEDLHYDQMRWGFLGLALGSFCAYITLIGFQRGVFYVGTRNGDK